MKGFCPLKWILNFPKRSYPYQDGHVHEKGLCSFQRNWPFFKKFSPFSRIFALFKSCCPFQKDFYSFKRDLALTKTVVSFKKRICPLKEILPFPKGSCLFERNITLTKRVMSFKKSFCHFQKDLVIFQGLLRLTSKLNRLTSNLTYKSVNQQMCSNFFLVRFKRHWQKISMPLNYKNNFKRRQLSRLFVYYHWTLDCPLTNLLFFLHIFYLLYTTAAIIIDLVK